MNYLDDIPVEKYTADFLHMTPTYSGATKTGEDWASVGTATCVLWRGSMVKNYVSGKYKDEVDAVAVFNYEDITFTIPKLVKISVNGKYYAMIYPDNICEQNELIQVLLKEYE